MVIADNWVNQVFYHAILLTSIITLSMQSLSSVAASQFILYVSLTYLEDHAWIGYNDLLKWC